MSNMIAPIMERPVTVCDRCFTASCWHGIFYCQAYQRAGTVDMTVAELHALNAEHPENWFKSPDTGIIDQDALEDYRAAVGKVAT